MLISERIAADRTFLHFPKNLIKGRLSKQFNPWLQILRNKIINSEKFVIPDYLGGSIQTTNEVIGRMVAAKSSKNDGITFLQEREHQYTLFSKLPFDLTVIENNELCWLLEKYKDHFSITIVHKNGDVNTVTLLIEGVGKDQNVLNVFYVYYYSNLTGHVQPQSHFDKLELSTHEISRFICTAQKHTKYNSVCVFEALLYINAKNRREVEVKVSQGFKKVSKRNRVVPVGPDLVYKVLVLDRTKPTLVTTDDISNYIYSPSEGHVGRRATYVRGHLKVRKTGTYWWNPFIRDAKNALTVGMVDKTYDVKIPQTKLPN